MVNSMFASQIAGAAEQTINGPVSWLGFSFRLVQLPLGLFGVAVRRQPCHLYPETSARAGSTISGIRCPSPLA